MNRILTLGWFVLVGVVSAALLRLVLGWDAGPLEWGLTIGVAVLGMAAGAARSSGRIGVRVGLTLVLLGVTGLLTGARAAGRVLLPDDVWPSQGYAAVLTIACSVAAVGLVRRAPWSRWLVLALGLGGTFTGALNLSNWGAPFFTWGWPARQVLGHFLSPREIPSLWTTLLLTFGSALLAFGVAGKAMRDAFGKPFSPDQPHTVWQAPSTLVATVRWTLIAQFVGGAMSVLYALGQPVVKATAPSAFVLAVVFLAGALLTLARKTAGVFVLVVVGVGFLMQAAVTWSMSQAIPTASHIAVFYGVFWVAAGLAGVASGVMLVRAARR